nr:MAG TPA: hypothetical protein [Caudoviricetes sp.]
MVWALPVPMAMLSYQTVILLRVALRRMECVPAVKP